MSTRAARSASNSRTAAIPAGGAAERAPADDGPHPLASSDAIIQRKPADASYTLQCLDAAGRPDLYDVPVQRREAGGAATGGGSSLISPTGGGRPLDDGVRGTMEHAFAADFSSVRVHEGSHVADVGAVAYAQGTDLHFSPGTYAPDSQQGRELIGHELAHVVQQSQGRVAPTTQAKGLAVNNDSALEREADDLGARAARGERVATTPTAIAGAAAGPAQCYAFVAGKQVLAADPDLDGTTTPLVKDTVVRDYKDKDEFKAHAAKSTDYLGNLADGTWLRFSPTGINLVGENHTLVTLDQVCPAVNSKSFIYEPFSSDAMANGSEMKKVYETENADRFKTFGVDKENDKQKYGAESLYPKMGFGMVLAIPYFNGSESLDGLKKASYVGQPIQRYLKIAWGFSKDNKAEILAKESKNEAVNPGAKKLATCHAKHEGTLDAFISPLAVDGYLGDELDKNGNSKHLPALLEFAQVFVDAMVEMAVNDPSSRLKGQEKQDFKDGKGDNDDKEAMFAKWRDYKFEDNVALATQNNVRYAGMGQNHLKHLVKLGLTGTQHPFYLADTDLQKFQNDTKKLAQTAVQQ